MNIVKNENIDPFDVDGCLIIHEDINTIPNNDLYMVLDEVSGAYIAVRINKAMVRLLKESKSRGSFVLVWSRSGYTWASNVIKALGLEEYVDMVMSKPTKYFDDCPVEEWLPDRVFIDHKTVYKNVITNSKGAK